MNARLDEARESIRSEGVDQEVWFRLKASGSDFVIGVMVRSAESGPPAISNHPIDAVHGAFKLSAWDRSVRFPSREIVSVDTKFSAQQALCIMRCFRITPDHLSLAREFIRSALLDNTLADAAITHSVFSYDVGADAIVAWMMSGSEESIARAREMQTSLLRSCIGLVHEYESPEILLNVGAELEDRS